MIADIGGTSARFALLDDEGATGSIEVLSCADHASLAAAILEFLGGQAPEAPPSRAAIAVASPVTGDRVDLTNNDWSFSISALQAELRLSQLSVVNDFTAIALSVPVLDNSDLLGVGAGAAAPETPIAVLGPGTGLGVSGLVPAEGRWVPLATEGGHATLAPVGGREIAVVRELARRFDHVSIERAVSGPGLVNLHAALAVIDGAPAEPLSPDEITNRALARTDPLCVEALDMFAAMLGTAAGNLALSLGARGGVYIAGGIVPRLASYFATSPFRERFESKGRFREYLKRIPTSVIMRPVPALLGLAALLRDAR